jgi:hypothetical protein
VGLRFPQPRQGVTAASDALADKERRRGLRNPAYPPAPLRSLAQHGQAWTAKPCGEEDATIDTGINNVLLSQVGEEGHETEGQCQ